MPGFQSVCRARQEYASGGELFERIIEAGRLPEDEARFYFQQLISGIAYCHKEARPYPYPAPIPVPCGPGAGGCALRGPLACCPGRAGIAVPAVGQRLSTPHTERQHSAL